MDDAARDRLMQNLGKWVLSISAVHDEFPDDWDEAMGIVLGSAIEHVMASGSYGGADWQFRYIDPERYTNADGARSPIVSRAGERLTPPSPTADYG
jgi:hypothetical protein